MTAKRDLEIEFDGVTYRLLGAWVSRMRGPTSRTIRVGQLFDDSGDDSVDLTIQFDRFEVLGRPRSSRTAGERYVERQPFEIGDGFTVEPPRLEDGPRRQTQRSHAEAPPPPLEPTEPRTWRAVLGFAARARPFFDEVRAAYKRLALTRHPDHGGSNEAMVELNGALEQAEDEYNLKGSR